MSHRLAEIESAVAPEHSDRFSESSSTSTTGIYPVYLAGKISGTSWRSSIFPALGKQARLEACESDEHRGVVEEVITGEAIAGQFKYAGPWYFGTTSLPEILCAPHDIRYGEADAHGQRKSPDYRDIARFCRTWMSEAEAVFAWIDTTSICGTLIEIGWASTLHIPVMVASPFHSFDEKIRDMDFAFNLHHCPPADFWSRTGTSLEEAWAEFAQQAPKIIERNREVSRKCHAKALEDREIVRAYRSQAEQFTGNGYVYLIRAETGACKIGKSKNLNDRMKHFTVKLPFKTDFVHAIVCRDMSKTERDFHRLFEKQRINGEWFLLDDHQIEFFKGIRSCD